MQQYVLPLPKCCLLSVCSAVISLALRFLPSDGTSLTMLLQKRHFSITRHKRILLHVTCAFLMPVLVQRNAIIDDVDCKISEESTTSVIFAQIPLTILIAHIVYSHLAHNMILAVDNTIQTPTEIPKTIPVAPEQYCIFCAVLIIPIKTALKYFTYSVSAKLMPKSHDHAFRSRDA